MNENYLNGIPIDLISLDFFVHLDLKYVRIYFDATTFDQITKDSAVKGVDMLSAIGGTMGLLTGFSIISAVEILYFALKIIFNILKRRCDIKDPQSQHIKQ